MNAIVRRLSPSRPFDADIPTLESVSNEYARLVAKRSEILNRLTALRAERDQLRAGINRPGSGLTAEDPSRGHRVAALMGDPVPSQSDMPSPPARLTAVVREISEAEEAEALIEHRLRHAACEASLIVCEKVKPAYEVIVRNLLNAAIDLHRANAEHTAFCDRMNDANIQWSLLNPVFARFAGEPRDPWSPLRMFLSEAVDEGWLKRDSLPADIRE